MKARPRRAEDSRPAEAVIAVRIQPRASKNEVVVQSDGSLKIRLTAPPVDGAANEALVRYLADILGVAKSQVEIVSGHTGREKRIRIAGRDPDNVLDLLKRSGD